MNNTSINFLKDINKLNIIRCTSTILEIESRYIYATDEGKIIMNSNEVRLALTFVNYTFGLPLSVDVFMAGGYSNNIDNEYFFSKLATCLSSDLFFLQDDENGRLFKVSGDILDQKCTFKIIDDQEFLFLI